VVCLCFSPLCTKSRDFVSRKLTAGQYLNNLIEQDHRFIKRLVKPRLGFVSFETAWRTLQGYETMNMLRKGQVNGVVRGDIKGQVTFFASLFGAAA
jgi:IS6 family transposase